MMTFVQGTNEARDYQVALRGDTVASATASITPEATLGVPVTTSTTARVRVSGLVAGKTYALTLHVVGGSGQQYDDPETSTLIRCAPVTGACGG